MKDLTAKLITLSPLILAGVAGVVSGVAEAGIVYSSNKDVAYQLVNYVSAFALGFLGVTCLAGVKNGAK